jgi:hypothetical protein
LILWLVPDLQICWAVVILGSHFAGNESLEALVVKGLLFSWQNWFTEQLIGLISVLLFSIMNCELEVRVCVLLSIKLLACNSMDDGWYVAEVDGLLILWWKYADAVAV